jgi:uncharacterized membrane protein YqjE
MFGAMDRIQDLVARLTDELRTLIRLEIQLIQTEMTDKAKSAARALAYAAIAGVFAFFAVFGLLIALIWGIGEFMPIWGSALIVTALFLLLAALVGFIAYRRAQRAVPVFPDEAIDAVKTMPEEIREALEHEHEHTGTGTGTGTGG